MPDPRPTIAVVFGTRPEAIKMAPVVLALRNNPAIRTLVWVTGQHRQMLDQVLASFAITPDADLNVMKPNQSLAGLTSRTLTELDRMLVTEKPRLLLVQGDTTTAFAAALTAFYHRIPVGHVEAGLRTGNPESPWPEEMNRVLISRVASLHFAPTATSCHNLLREGVPPANIHITGNTVVDAFNHTKADMIAEPPHLAGQQSPFVLITCHRRENFGPGLASVCTAIAALARRFTGVHFVFVVHLNPNVRGPVHDILQSLSLPNVVFLDPQPYPRFLRLCRQATVLLSDSGGLQEEATLLRVPLLLMRDTTERPEAVEVGAVKLVGTDVERIVVETSRLLTDPAARQAMIDRENPFGDGHAAERIAAISSAFVGVS